MPISHAAVKARKGTAIADFGELGTIAATYFKSIITPQFLETGVELKDGESASMSDVRFLAQVLDGWDYLDEKGKPFKTTEEVLKGLPSEILDRVVRAVIEDLRPKPPSETPTASFA